MIYLYKVLATLAIFASICGLILGFFYLVSAYPAALLLIPITAGLIFSAAIGGEIVDELLS